MNLFFAGFRGSYWPTAPPNHGLEDNRPDVHDEADFDCVQVSLVIYIDGSFIKHGIPVKPIYC
jgi:hypothetical protein